jgi:uncharacterized protein (TIGR00730 family)
MSVAKELGELLAQKDVTLVYGGAQVGLMGVVADSVLASGGRAIGVVPKVILENEVEHKSLTEIHHVGTMHERKALMALKSDAFVALPGGFGTLDEFFEILTWAQLNIHQKPIYLINVEGFFDNLLKFLDQAVEQGFVNPKHRSFIHTFNTISDFKNFLDK